MHLLSCGSRKKAEWRGQQPWTQLLMRQQRLPLCKVGGNLEGLKDKTLNHGPDNELGLTNSLPKCYQLIKINPCLSFVPAVNTNTYFTSNSFVSICWTLSVCQWTTHTRTHTHTHVEAVRWWGKEVGSPRWSSGCTCLFCSSRIEAFHS